MKYQIDATGWAEGAIRLARRTATGSGLREWKAWATRWLRGEDRSEQSARKAKASATGFLRNLEARPRTPANERKIAKAEMAMNASSAALAANENDFYGAQGAALRVALAKKRAR